MARAQQQDMGSSITDDWPLLEGGVTGALAHVAGFILTFVLIQIDSDLKDEILTPTIEEMGGGLLEVTSWVYASAHLIVDMQISGSGGGESRSETSSLFSEASASLPEPLYYAVPIIVLVGAGYLLVQQFYISSSEEAMKKGASVTIGYLPVALVTAFLFRVQQSEETFGQTVSVTFGPDMAMVGLTGILFPAVLGAAGGYIAFSQSADSSKGGGYQQQPPAQQQDGYQQGGHQQGRQQGGYQQGGQQDGYQQGRQQDGYQQGNDQRER